MKKNHLIRSMCVIDNVKAHGLYCELSEVEKYYLGKAWSLMSFEDQIRCGLGYACFLKGNGQLTGFILYQKIFEVLEIILLISSVKHRRQGIMSFLMMHLIEEYNQTEVKEVWVDVHVDNNPAIEFYKKMDFLLVGERNHYYHSKDKSLLYSFKMKS